MKFPLLLLFALIVAASPVAAQATGSPKPARINKAIELLEQGQPVYYANGSGGYEEGKKLAQTPADYINYEMEHGAFDMNALREFMRGLVDGGPTKSGHRTPAVIVTLPVLGLDEASMRANSWVVQQVLAAGVHGILLCHARAPEAARVMVEASRYPFAEKVEGLGQGFRGSGPQGRSARRLREGAALSLGASWPGSLPRGSGPSSCACSPECVEDRCSRKCAQPRSGTYERPWVRSDAFGIGLTPT